MPGNPRQAGTYGMYTTHRKFQLTLVALATWLASVSSLWAGVAEDQYRVAAGHYSVSRWQLAVDEFELLLDRHPDHPVSEEATFFLAEALVQLGRYTDARPHYLRFVEQHGAKPLGVQAQFRLGETAFLLQNLIEARTRLEEFLDEHPDDARNAYGLSFLGEIELVAERSEAARDRFAEALRRYPDGPLAADARFGLAQAQAQLGEFEQAAEHFSLLAGSSHDLSDDARLQWGIVLYRQQDYAATEEVLALLNRQPPSSSLATDARYWGGLAQHALGNWGEAARLLEQATSPEHPRRAASAHFYAGDALRRAGQPERAEQLLLAVSDNFPNSPWADDSLLARIDLALETERHDDVARLVEDFSHRFPNSEMLDAARRKLGRSLLIAGKYDEAAGVLRPLAISHSSDTGAPADDAHWDHYLLGLAHLGAGENERAWQTLDSIPSAGQPPELLAGVQVARATALLGLQRFEEALTPLQTYLESQPAGSDAAKCRADRSLALASLHRYAEAKLALEEFVQQHPQHHLFLPTVANLAEIAYEADQREWAHELFTVLARDGNPQHYQKKGLSGLAWSQLESNAPNESATTFEQLIQLDPDGAVASEAGLMRAHALDQAGQPDAALAAYLSVIDRFPGSQHAGAALRSAANLQARRGRDGEAAGLYERLVAEHPQHSQLDAVLYDWAWMLFDNQRPAEADQLFARIHNQHRDSTYWHDATYRLAEHASSAQDYARARRLAGELIQSGVDGSLLAHALYLDGHAASLSGDWQLAHPSLERLISELPDSQLRVPAEYWLAEGLYQESRIEEAGLNFEALDGRLDGTSPAWMAMIPLRRAQILAQRESWHDAEEIAEQIATRFPQFRQQYEVDYLLGRCHAAQARFEQARAAYRRVTDSPIGGKTETAAMAQWMIGEGHFHQKQYDDAIRAYLRVEILYDFPRWQAGGLLQAGKCFELKGEWDEAVRLYGRLLQHFPHTTFAGEATKRLNAVTQN